MVRGEADLALPQLDVSFRRSSSSTTSSAAGGAGVSDSRRRRSGGGGGGETKATGKGGGQGCGLLGLQVSAYARLTLARLASQVTRMVGSSGMRPMVVIRLLFWE